jgi:hypothetical protein
MRMVSQIDELLSAILHLRVKPDSAEDTLSPATLHNIAKFAESIASFSLFCRNLVDTEFSTLQKIHSFIEAQQKNSKFRRFFRQSENTGQLEVCNAGLRHALDVFGVRS